MGDEELDLEPAELELLWRLMSEQGAALLPPEPIVTSVERKLARVGRTIEASSDGVYRLAPAPAAR